MLTPLTHRHSTTVKLLQLTLGLCLGLLFLLVPFNPWQPSSLEPLQTLAVQLDGRKKPLDTVALETIAKIHGSDHYRPTTGENLTTLETYLSLWFNNRDWNQEPFILLSYRPLKVQLGLDPSRKYFTFQELVHSPLGPLVLQVQEKQQQDEDLTRDEREVLILEERLDLLFNTVGQAPPIVPHPTAIRGRWVSPGDAQQYYSVEQIAPILSTLETMQQSYAVTPEPSKTLGQLATALKQDLVALSPTVYPKPDVLKQEVHYHRLHPFRKAWQLYAIAFCVMLLVAGFKLNNMYWPGVGLFSAGVLVQGYGFLMRMQIAGRPPVTNMYESVVWVGLGIAAIALLFELRTRVQSYLLVAAPLAIVCLLLADSLPAVLDASIQPLVPVLRDNFWLSIHVPTITLGYASFALALGLGHLILGHYIVAPQAQERLQTLAKLNYQVLQIGVLLLTTGIILGGIWAHFAWGRFWGWDPKETWALIALLCYLAPLHGRLVGWLGDFGLAVTSVVAFNAVLMAWYGVNFVLGQGLHSYGFGTGGSAWVIASLIGLDLLFLLLAVARRQRSLLTAGDRSPQQEKPSLVPGNRASLSNQPPVANN